MSKAKELLTLIDKIKLVDKAAILRERFQDKPDFTISDAVSVLQEKKSTLYWTLHKLANSGYLSRTGQGLYSFQNRKAESIQPILSTLASRILDVLKETGHDFFISGLDILTVFMDHVPETYPVLLFEGKSVVEEIADILSRNKIDVVPHANIKDYSTIRRMSSVNELALLIPTQEIKEEFSKDFEKYSDYPAKVLKGKSPARILWAVVNTDHVNEISSWISNFVEKRT